MYDHFDIYTDPQGHEHDAIFYTWDEIEAILGRPHRAMPGDDPELIAYIIADGAPAWIADGPEGWADEDGWGLIGPERPDD